MDAGFRTDKGKAREVEEDAVETSEPEDSLTSRLQDAPASSSIKKSKATVVLPFELILEIIRILQAQCINGDPSAERALIAFSQTSKTLREWSLDALYRILILPRHVREFRRFYNRQRTSYRPFSCAGYTRALFCGLDDVSRLNAMTAGWEPDLVRLLHYIGPHLDYLSLWNAESRVLLRDPIQVKGQRTAGVLQPAFQWDDPSLDDVDFPTPAPAPAHGTTTGSNKGKQAQTEPEGEDSDEDPLPNISDLPGWLRAEYERLPLREFYRRHKAHVAFRTKTSDILMVQQRRRGCRPRFLSMVISFPFYENEAESAFPRMTIWSRVEELDLHVPVTKDVARVLKLVSLLHRSPLRRLRISSQHASIALAVPPFRAERPHNSSNLLQLHPSSRTFRSDNVSSDAKINLARGLGRICASCVLFDLVMAEFQGHHAPARELERLQDVLEAAVLSEADGVDVSDAELWKRARRDSGGASASGDGPGGSAVTAEGSRLGNVRPGSLASTLGVGLRISDDSLADSPDGAISTDIGLGGDGYRSDDDEDLPPWARFPSSSISPLPASSQSREGPAYGKREEDAERIRVRIKQRGQDVHGKLRFRLQDFRERAELRGPGAWASMGVWDE
ncbi:hypothetical protein OC842_000141 [Tilletia horrida]|uniref:Uncharacterized protein n=1 Tax=Tilletia horrida TaxID=155126 RepID=A0AAN6JUG3_9BASI|nr:hypothetical protein OC842_000141 [Tilletia horrida]